MAYINNNNASETAWQYYYSNHYEEAVGQIDEVLLQEPYNAPLHYLKADCLYRLNRCQEAENHCKRALQYQYESGACLSLLGNIYTKMKSYAKAQAMYVKALQVEPDNSTITARYGYLMLVMGQKEKALRLIERALQINPADETANQIKAIYEQLDRSVKQKKNSSNNDKKISIMEEDSVNQKGNMEDPYLRICRNEKKRLCQIGYSKLKAGKIRAARDVYRQALQVDEKDLELKETIYHLDQKVHVLFMPNRVIRRLGGVYLVGVELLPPILVLLYFHRPLAVLGVILFYVLFCMLAWFAPEIYQAIYKYPQE